MTLRSRIIPSLLISDQGLVKTRRFGEPKYIGDPINAVKIFNEKEVDELMIFDIDATVNGNPPDFENLKSIAAESRMPLCYGGGISSVKEAKKIISIGFEKVSISASAMSRPELIKEISEEIGAQSTVVSIDVKRKGLFGKISIFSHNGKVSHAYNFYDFIQKIEKFGLGELLINSIDRDGMMKGYDLNLAKDVRQCVDLPITFLGGAGSADDISDLITTVGTVGAAVGSFFVFNGVYRAVLISYTRPQL
jgi:imidazole glycerol-phosphate synthase subunit HisF